MVELGNATCREARANVRLKAHIVACLIRCPDGGGDVYAEVTVVRIAQRGDHKQLLADLPVVHDVGAVVAQRGFVDIGFCCRL